MPKANNPNKGPYVYPAALNIALITLSSLIKLNIWITMKIITEKRKCTFNLIEIFSFSLLLSKFKKSIQNAVVNEVKAESAQIGRASCRERV